MQPETTEKEMTAITTLRNEIVKHPADSDVVRLLSWAELTMGDLHDHIFELEEEAQRLTKENESLRTAMRCFSDLIEEANRFLQKKSFEFGADVFAKDFAPWRNVMAANGMKQDGAPIARRKKKAA